MALISDIIANAATSAVTNMRPESADAIAAAILTALHSRGLAVVDRQQHIDWIAEAEDRVNTIHATLRHRQQPQDVTFHLAQKALRDARNSLSARPEGA